MHMHMIVCRQALAPHLANLIQSFALNTIYYVPYWCDDSSKIDSICSCFHLNYYNVCACCAFDFIPIEHLCLNESSSSDESSDDETRMTAQGNLHELE